MTEVFAQCETIDAGSISGVVTVQLPEGGPPSWITVFPSLGMISTRDGRSYQVDADRLIRAFQEDGIAVPIDVNHQTDTAAATGGRCDAVGWIWDLRVNAGKLEARVEWLDEGKALIKERRYRYTSPSFYHTQDRLTTRLKAVALVTAPALANQIALAGAGLAASHAGHAPEMSDRDRQMKAAMEKAAELASKAKAYKAEFDAHNRESGLSMSISDAVAHVEALENRKPTALLSQGAGSQASSLATESAFILTKARAKILEELAVGKHLSISDAVAFVEMEELAKNASTLASRGDAGRYGVAFEAMQLLSDARKRIQEMKSVGLSLSVSDAISLGERTPPEAFSLLSKAAAFMQSSLLCGRAVELADAVSAVE